MADSRHLLDGLAKIYMRKSQVKTETVKLPAAPSDINLDENYIRREKRRKLETKKEIEKMRAELPNYDIYDIRLFKLPFYQALTLRLQETGYVSTEAYIKQLFELNEQIRKEAGPQSVLWNWPLLMHSDNELKKLSDALMKAEDETKKENYREVTEILLVVAIDFAFNYEGWFWLAEELILQCITNAHKNKTTGKHEAISRYIYAKILMEKGKDFEKAEQELNLTRELSVGKSWNVKAFLPEQNDSNTLFMNANFLLHLCYMRQARHWIVIDSQKALEFATLARKRAVEACYRDGETMALFLKGQCELNLGNTKDAVSTFNKAYYIQAKLQSNKGMCEARVELSKAYLMHGSTRLALNTLLTLKSMAEQHGFQYYLAQAFRYLGEYYLNCGEPYKATPLLSDALDIFHSIGDHGEADQVRNLGALSAGLELMPAYINLIQKTDRRCPDWFDNLIKLVRWKDSREPFVVEKEVRVSGVEFLSQTLNSSGWDQHLQSIVAPTVENKQSLRIQRSEFAELSTIFDPGVAMNAEEQQIEQKPPEVLSANIANEEDVEEQVDTISYT